FGLESLVALDQAPKFVPAAHLRPANVSALIYVVSMLDVERVQTTGEAVCVLGNSMGWYTALAVGGALSFEDGFRLVQHMALLQEKGVSGGQLIYPLVDEDWVLVPEREAAVRVALEALPGQAFPSIHLAGYTVLAGDEAGLAALRKALPPVQQGGVNYPLRLAQHGPYHTPLAQGVADDAQRHLQGLQFGLPQVPLVDGRGMAWSPWSSDLHKLRAYTLGAQVTQPYNLTASIVTALKEYAPDRLVLLGPGNTLGGICGQVLIQERWQGIDSRAAFTQRQAGPEPILDSLGRGR
ncbi:MAG TPA: ACP S-malonyltransferase, partial [Planctomycetota bacterium]|nr:ACP S-malonyltransferase [Planctomycetota bacterium]